MTLELASFLVTVGVLVLQGFSMYTTVRLKLWVTERFVSKTDFLESLHLWSKQEFKNGEKNHA